jgi:O-succinylbenzoic acid--CoA ligase
VSVTPTPRSRSLRSRLGGGPGPSLRPVSGTAEEILGLLREWDAADDPEPLIVETSGSTGVPKRVVLSRAAMRASADATHARLGGPGQWLLALPPTYVAGLQVLFRSVRAGTEPVVLSDHGDLGDGNALMSGGRRYVALVPTQLHRAVEGGRDVLSQFDTALIGGASLDPALRERAVAVGATIVTTYGMSETCGGCVYDGVPLDRVEVATTADGRVRIRGPVLFDGYDGQPGLTAEVLQDGWFVTQDLGRIGEAGRVLVGGRVDDVINTGGVKVPAAEVALEIRLHPRVRAAEVLGMPDEEWGEVVVAAVVGDVTLEELRDWVAEEYPRSFAPRSVVHLDALPLLSNGKVDRVSLKARLGTARGAGRQ